MPTYQFGSYTNVQIKGEDDFVQKAAADLNRIHKMGTGPAFFMAINGTKHMLTVGPRDPVDSPSNYCENANNNGMTLLTQAIVTADDDRFKNALGAGLAKAAKAGINREFVARQLTGGLMAVTYDSAQNVGRPTSKVVAPPTATTGADVMAHAAHQTMQSMAVLDELVTGTRKLSNIPRGWDRDLQRILRPWLQVGRGCACTIGFNPDQSYPCDADPARKNRPPVIGLVHEMVHAWRFMTGRTLEIRGSGGFDIEEAITTGFAPYNSEQFSENLFRSQFSEKELIMRTTYGWLESQNRAVPSSG